MRKNKFLAIAFLFIAMVSVAFSIVCFALVGDVAMYGGTEPSNKYGADFYTDVQNAAAQAANNAYNIGFCIEVFAEHVMIIFGFFFIVTALTFFSLSMHSFFLRNSLEESVRGEAPSVLNTVAHEISTEESDAPASEI